MLADLQITTTEEVITVPNTTPEQYAERIWGSVTSDTMFTPVGSIFSGEEITNLKHEYLRDASKLASGMMTPDGGIASPYTMLWVIGTN